MIKINRIDFGGGGGGGGGTPVAGGGTPPTHTTESAITSQVPIHAVNSIGYASWAGITASKVLAGASYLIRIVIDSLPDDGSVYVALSTDKTIDGAMASWNVAGTYQVVVTNTGADSQLYLLSVNIGSSDTVPTPAQVSSIQVNKYDDTYTPDPRDTTPALLQSIKLRDYVQAVLDKHDTGILWSSDDAAAIDTDSGYAGVGVFLSGGETINDVINLALNSYTSCKWCDNDGLVRFTRMIDPDLSTAQGTIDTNSMLGEVIPSQDTAPALSTRMGARRNWEQFSDGDLLAPSTNFPPAVRQYLLSAYQQVMQSAKPLAQGYAHAIYAEPAPSTFDNQEDAQTEIDRICAIYETQRWFYSMQVELSELAGLDLGQVWSLVYPIYSLKGGKNVMVIDYHPDFLSNTANIVLWG